MTQRWVQSRRWLGTGLALSYAVFPLTALWFIHMCFVGAGIDAYPSRWIHGLPFVTLILVGSLSGWVTAAAFIRNNVLRGIAVAIGLTTFLLFMATVKLNFEQWSEPYWSLDEDKYVFPAALDAAYNLAIIMGLAAVGLWILSLVVPIVKIVIGDISDLSFGRFRTCRITPRRAVTICLFAAVAVLFAAFHLSPKSIPIVGAIVPWLFVLSICPVGIPALVFLDDSSWGAVLLWLSFALNSYLWSYVIVKVAAWIRVRQRAIAEPERLADPRQESKQTDRRLYLSQQMLERLAIAAGLIEVPFVLLELLSGANQHVPFWITSSVAVWLGSISGSAALAAFARYWPVRIAVLLVFGIVTPAAFMWSSPAICDRGVEAAFFPTAVNIASRLMGVGNVIGWVSALTLLPARQFIAHWRNRRSNRTSGSVGESDATLMGPTEAVERMSIGLNQGRDEVFRGAHLWLGKNIARHEKQPHRTSSTEQGALGSANDVSETESPLLILDDDTEQGSGMIAWGRRFSKVWMLALALLFLGAGLWYWNGRGGDWGWTGPDKQPVAIEKGDDQSADAGSVGQNLVVSGSIATVPSTGLLLHHEASQPPSSTGTAAEPQPRSNAVRLDLADRSHVESSVKRFIAERSPAADSSNPKRQQEDGLGTAHVTGDRVILRAAASMEADVVGMVYRGETLEVLTREGEWAAVVPPKRIGLWVHRDYVKSGQIQIPVVNVRTRPSITAPRVGTVKKGDVVNVRGQAGEWLEIEPPTKCCLWVNRRYLDGRDALSPAERPQ